MKKLVLSLCVLSTICLAQDKVQPSVEDYQSELKYLDEFSKKFGDVGFYKDWELQNRSTPNAPATNIKDLTSLQKAVFFAQQAEVISARMLYMNQAWSEVASQIKSLTPEEAKLEDSHRPPSKDDMLNFTKQLHQLRKDHAVRHEFFIKTMLENVDSFKDELKEGGVDTFKTTLSQYLIKIQQYNKDNNLK